ncbi:hypothetical protein DFP72DRAFT_862471 [Ephemerocybe angulata]|uniref:Uncharacterized protein n=1 Tax=Ephemerocybe angulata TaxID=980116 RepID=A0A8H6LUJ8_9AGAR|nr:hypothetical protein DFP72DRAFT_862471 [Tulosesus angulatus]
MAEMEDEFDVVVGDTFIILPEHGDGGLYKEILAGLALSIRTLSNRAGFLPDAYWKLAFRLRLLSQKLPPKKFRKKGDEELDLVKDDALRVFKRYNHWSYAVKEVGGDRGWVPFWFIGKVSASGVVPQTPSSGSMNHNSMSIPGDEPGQSQISPMSSAFPPVSQSQRSTNVI